MCRKLNPWESLDPKCHVAGFWFVFFGPHYLSFLNGIHFQCKNQGITYKFPFLSLLGQPEELRVAYTATGTRWLATRAERCGGPCALQVPSFHLVASLVCTVYLVSVRICVCDSWLVSAL